MGICKADCIWVDGEKMTPLDVSENAVKKSCHDLLKKIPCAYGIRTNAGQGAQINGRYIKLAEPGTADEIWCIAGKFVAIEFKRMKGGRQSETQKAFQARIEACGGVYLLCNTAAPLRLFLQEEGLL